MESMRPSIIKWVKQYLVNQKSAPPLLFFLFIIYANLVPHDNGFVILHFFGLALIVLTKYNFLFLLPSFIYTRNYFLVALFFATSAVFSNKKWKLYLFIYSVIDSYFIFNKFNINFIALASLYLAILTYKNLVFQTQSDNKQYFIGFFVITIINAINLVFDSIGSQSLQVSSLAAIAVLSGVVSYIIISNRFQGLRKSDSQSIREARLITLYLNMLKSDLEVPSIKKAKLEIHSKQCNKPYCFCKNKQHSSNISYFSRQIYEDTIRGNNQRNEESLSEEYIDFLITNKQATNALYFLQNWKTQSYFAFLTRLKCEAKIQAQLDNQNSSNPYEKEYTYGLEYDQHCLTVTTKIYQILKMKINFWKQVSKQVLSLNQLQKMGCSIVEKMYDLNKFYNIEIKKYEKVLYSFDATVLYSMYLISTTNFKDYAKGIIKSTAKLMEEVYVSEGNVCEIFAIRTLVKKVGKSFIREFGNRFQAEQALQTKLRLQASFQNEFRLVIDRVSNGFCRLLNMEKSLLQGLQLNSIIPDGYKQVHNTRLSYLLDFKSESLKEIVPSKVFHNQLKLPFKGKNNQILSGIICIKYQVDIEQGLTFVSIIKKVPDRKCEALLNFNGKITEMEKGFMPQIVQHPEVKQYLKELRECWQRERVIKEEKFNMMINTQNYEVTLSSPLLILFLEKENLKSKEPPIHIQFVNEENNKFKNMSVLGNNHTADIQIKKMEKMLIHYDQESSTTSTKGISSAVTVISNFSENNSVPVYKYIISTFVAIILCSIALNLILNFLAILEWDNSLATNNPIFDNLNTYLLEIFESKAVLHIQDEVYYNQYKNILNMSRVNSYYPPPSYLQSSVGIFNNLENSWNAVMASLFGFSSALLQPAIKQRFNQPIIVTNNFDNQTFARFPTQNLTYLEILSIYGTDFNLATQKNDYKELLISSLYQETEAQLLNSTVLSTTIDESISVSKSHQIIMGVAFSVFLVLLLIPMHLVLKKRYQAHEKVFDLLSSIDCEQVQKQIESLLYISNIISNYDQSQEKLKTNVLEYESNKIKPKHSDSKRRPSVQNQIVMGLSKFDVSRNLPVHPVQPDKERHVTVLFQYKSMFSMIKTEMFKKLTEQSALKKRKRSGELELAGSQYERNFKPSVSHCTIYTLLLTFIFLLIGCMIFNLNFITQIQTTKDTTTQAYQSLQSLNNKIYNAKFFLWEGSLKYEAQVGISNEIKQLTSIILSVIDFSGSKDTHLIPPSSLNTVKLNQYVTSYLMLQSEMESLLKNLVEERYSLDNNSTINGSRNGTLFVNNYQKIFYLQSLNTQIEVMIESITNTMLAGMISYSLTTSSQKTIFLVCVVVWSAISLALGLVVIIAMKKQFFKEVYIITFLNDEMVMKNKRVESYLETLSKNTYL